MCMSRENTKLKHIKQNQRRQKKWKIIKCNKQKTVAIVVDTNATM